MLATILNWFKSKLTDVDFYEEYDEDFDVEYNDFGGILHYNKG